MYLRERKCFHRKKLLRATLLELSNMCFILVLFFLEDQLVMILIDIFLAGLSITTNTLDLIFMNTVVHQDIQQKVQKEIDSVISTDRIPDLTDKPK